MMNLSKQLSLLACCLLLALTSLTTNGVEAKSLEAQQQQQQQQHQKKNTVRGSSSVSSTVRLMKEDKVTNEEVTDDDDKDVTDDDDDDKETDDEVVAVEEKEDKQVDDDDDEATDDKEAPEEAAEETEEPEVPAEETNDKDNKQDDNDDDETDYETPEEAAEDDLGIIEGAVEATEVPADDATTTTEDMGDMAATSAPVEEGEEDDSTTQDVALEPFSVTISGDIAEEDLNMEDYLMQQLSSEYSNLESVTLTMVGEEAMTMTNETETSDSNSTRALSSTYEEHQRFLQGDTVTYYYEGFATFDTTTGGAATVPQASEVSAQVSTALADEIALVAFIGQDGVTATADVGATLAPSSTVNGAASDATEAPSNGDLTTTGLAIVIVAGSIGGISLLIIVLVGMCAPSGAAVRKA